MKKRHTQAVPRPFRYLWATPASAIGLLLALPLLLAGGRAQRVNGVLEVAAPAWRPLARLPFCAITLGHVVLGISPAVLAHWRQHEHIHVRQYERWGGLMLLAYPAASLWLWLRGKRPYLDNPFEREARGETRQRARRG